MKRLKYIFPIVVFVSLPLTGCGKVVMEDVSHEDTYAIALGKRVTTRAPTVAIGISRDASRDRTDYFVLRPLPGFGGREVTKYVSIPSGTEFSIVGVLKATNSLFSRIEYVAQPLPEDLGINEVKIRLVDSVMSPNFGLPSDTYVVDSPKP